MGLRLLSLVQAQVSMSTSSRTDEPLVGSGIRCAACCRWGALGPSHQLKPPRSTPHYTMWLFILALQPFQKPRLLPSLPWMSPFLWESLLSCFTMSSELIPQLMGPVREEAEDRLAPGKVEERAGPVPPLLRQSHHLPERRGERLRYLLSLWG